jgi:hypothetical protein
MPARRLLLAIQLTSCRRMMKQFRPHSTPTRDKWSTMAIATIAAASRIAAYATAMRCAVAPACLPFRLWPVPSHWPALVTQLHPLAMHLFAIPFLPCDHHRPDDCA